MISLVSWTSCLLPWAGEPHFPKSGFTAQARPWEHQAINPAGAGTRIFLENLVNTMAADALAT